MTNFKSNMNPMFRSKFSEDIFNLKYSHTGCDTWEQLSRVLVEDVCGNLRSGEEALILGNSDYGSWHFSILPNKSVSISRWSYTFRASAPERGYLDCYEHRTHHRSFVGRQRPRHDVSRCRGCGASYTEYEKNRPLWNTGSHGDRSFDSCDRKSDENSGSSHVRGQGIHRLHRVR